ncbi:MAG: glycine cleavage system protein H [Thaumarchaeota archaeon]|nr:glycine cleavage system protein H [Nitrososphaerota archaeon]
MEEEIGFTKEHEWVIIKEGLALVGISDFAQNQLGDIVSIELPKIGSKFKYMEAMAIIDSIKASSDIYCPISGEIVELNEDLLEHPEQINQSPYDLGWIVKIKPLNFKENIKEFTDLMSKEQYDKYVGEIE